LKESSRDTCNQANHPHLRPNATTIESLVPALPRRLCASTRNPSDRKHLPRISSLWVPLCRRPAVACRCSRPSRRCHVLEPSTAGVVIPG
jgi:hypothetical protein